MNAVAPLIFSPDRPDPRAAQFLEHSPIAIAQCSSRGNITTCNAALTDLFGKKGNRAEMPQLADLIQENQREELQQLLRETAQGEHENFEVEAKPAAGTGGTLKLTGWRVLEGREASCLVIAEEIPDSWRTAQKLLRTCQLETVGRMASGVAHDFANLLTGVLLYCDLLMLALEPGTRLRKYAEEIRAAAMQATSMARELLSVARPRKASPQPLCLNEVAESMRGLLGRLVGQSVEVSLQLDPVLGLVRMDPTHAQQMILNLVLNARDAMPEGGKITISTSNCEMRVLGEIRPGANEASILPCVLFVVSDNGSGMDEVTMQHLFEAFFTTKGPEKGTGLGLTNVHDIVTGSGGLIHVDSELRCGTRVTVLLPQVGGRSPQPAITSEGAPLIPAKELIS